MQKNRGVKQAKDDIWLWFFGILIFFILVAPFSYATYKLYVDFAWRQLAHPPSEHGGESRPYKDIYTSKSESNFKENGVAPNSQTKEPECDAECQSARSNFEKSNEFIKDGRDLYAQEGMWRAANALVVLAFFQLLATITTIIFIWRTLSATKDTADAAVRTAEAAESAEKAHVYAIAEVEFYPMPYGPPTQSGIYGIYQNKKQPSLVFSIKNYGKTPARNIKCITNDFWAHIPKALDHKKAVNLLGSNETAHIHSAINLTKDYIGATASRKPIACVRIDYDDVFGNPRTTSFTVFWIEFFMYPLGKAFTISDDRIRYEAFVNSEIEGLCDVRLQAKYD